MNNLGIPRRCLRADGGFLFQDERLKPGQRKAARDGQADDAGPGHNSVDPEYGHAPASVPANPSPASTAATQLSTRPRQSGKRIP